MKKIFIIFTYFLFNIIGCCDDCNSDTKKVPAYVNASSQAVKIIAVVRSYYGPPEENLEGEKLFSTYEKTIANGDTLRSVYYNETAGIWDIVAEWPIYLEANHCGLVNNYCDDPIRMELRFLDESKKCLIFDGPIKDDGVDMRFWKSYKEGSPIENFADFWGGVEYIYTITLEHRNMAREEYCQ
jgi:hypothetical protein